MEDRAPRTIKSRDVSLMQPIVSSNTRLNEALRACAQRQNRLVVLSGAGISAESGIPTFRGPDGYWTVGSREYRAEEMATFQMFQKQPDEVWQWYLYRLGVCRKAKPNAAHYAVLGLEQLLKDSFFLITQNVDGLHLEAGNSTARTYEIHGNINYMRCATECTDEIFSIPKTVPPKSANQPLTDADRHALRCPHCGSRARPHVLWFDEYYDEVHYRYDSSIRAAINADILLIVGTSGTTNLPMQVGTLAAQRGALLVDINPNPTPFSKLAQQSGGLFAQGAAGDILPKLVEMMQ